MSSYTEGQVHQTVQALEEKGGFTSAHLTKLGQLKVEDLLLLRDVLDGRAEIKMITLVYLKLISSGREIILEPTDGTEMIGKAKDVFKTYTDSCFQSWNLNIPSVPTKKTKVQVYEMVKDGTFAQLFGSFGENLDRLCLTQSQIKQFCSNHSDWLRADGYGTFFLFKVNGQFFVARVDRGSDGLDVYVFRLSHDYVWGAGFRHRIVVPQL